MGRSQQTYSKTEREKKRLKKREEKQKRKEDKYHLLWFGVAIFLLFLFRDYFLS